VEAGCLGRPSVVNFFISKSCWVAMAGSVSPEKHRNYFSRECTAWSITNL